ncbi:MAG TPA: nuclear transport factor 2 family protein [Caldimonas sp.]|nr:nuclear transport factor 2 family protein [Caldimonas sp.]
MSTETHVALVQDAYAAFGTGDMPKLLGLMAPDVVWEFPASSVIPWAGTFTGADAVARFFSALVECSEPEMFEPLHYIASEDRVVVLGRERFRVKATGRTWACEWAHAFTVRDGKIAAFREYTDTAAMTQALGKG